MDKKILILIIVVVVVVLLAAVLLFYEMRKPKRTYTASAGGDCTNPTMLINGVSASKTPVTSLKDCQSYCDGLKGCTGVSYSLSQQTCAPKDTKVDLTTCLAMGGAGYTYYQANDPSTTK